MGRLGIQAEAETVEHHSHALLRLLLRLACLRPDQGPDAVLGPRVNGAGNVLVPVIRAHELPPAHLHALLQGGRGFGKVLTRGGLLLSNILKTQIEHLRSIQGMNLDAVQHQLFHGALVKLQLTGGCLELGLLNRSLLQGLDRSPEGTSWVVEEGNDSRVQSLNVPALAHADQRLQPRYLHDPLGLNLPNLEQALACQHQWLHVPVLLQNHPLLFGQVRAYTQGLRTEDANGLGSISSDNILA